MSDDIVTELRRHAEWAAQGYDVTFSKAADEIERIREALTAQEIAKVLHAHRHTKNVKVKGQGPDTVQHCSCGAALPDQGPVSGEDGQRIHRFDVHRAEVLAGVLCSTAL